MAVEMTTLAVKLDSTGVAAGMEQIGTAATKLGDRARQVTTEFARIEQEMQGVPRAAAPASAAFDDMGRKLDQITAAIREQTAAQREQIKRLDEAAREAAEYKKQVNDAAESTTLLSKGAAALGGLIGGLVAQGVLSLASKGIELLTEKMRAAGRAAEEERAKIKAFFDELDREIEAARKLRQPFSTAQGELQVVQRERAELEKQRAALEARIAATRDLPATLRNQLTPQQIEGPERQLAAINAELVKMDARAAQIRINLGERLGQAIEKRGKAFGDTVREIATAEKAAETAGKKAAAAAEQRRKSLEAMSITEVTRAAATAGNLAEELRLRREIIDRGIVAQVRAMEGLKGPEREREIANRKAIQDAIDYANTQERIRQAEAARLRQLRDFVKENKTLLDALRGNVATWQGQQLGKPQTVGDPQAPGRRELFGLEHAQRATSKNAQKTIEEQIEAEEKRIEAMRLATHGIADLSQQLWGLDAATANAIKSVADLAAGIATGNVGGIISGAVGLVGSVFGDGGRAERQAAREARAAQLDDINSFIDSIRPQGTALEELARSYKDLHDQGKRLGLGNHELARLTQAYANEVERLTEIERQRNAQLTEDLQVRALLAQGHDAEAEALRFAIDQQREYAEAVTAGYDAVTLATLAQVQAIEAEAEARRRATEEARQALELARQQRTLGSDFAERSARLSGQTLLGDTLAIERQLAAERDRFTDLLTNGIINEAEFRAWLALLEGEATKAIRDVTAAWQEQIDAAKRLRDETLQDTEVRILAALGYDEQANALARQIQQEREIQRLRAQGIDEETLARVRQAQQFEDARLASDRLAESIAKLAEQARQESYAFEELAGRRLRAMGNTDAASEAALLLQHRQQVDAALAAGRPDDYLAELRSVQALEREQFRRDREAEQLRAFQSAADHNFSLRDPFAEDSRTTMSLAVGVTEPTANALRGSIQAVVTQQGRWLPFLEHLQLLQYLPIIAARVGVPLSMDEIEAQFLERIGNAERAIGINPGNR